MLVDLSRMEQRYEAVVRNYGRRRTIMKASLGHDWGMVKLPATVAAVERLSSPTPFSAAQVAVVIDGKPTVVSAGTDAAGAPLTEATVVPWTCAGKPLLALAVLSLVGDGRLSLWAPLRDLVPGVPPELAAINPFHLLTHTAGIAEPEPRAVAAAGSPYHPAPQRECPPGARFSYSRQWNWSVLADIVEGITEAPARDLIRRRLIEPLGLKGFDAWTFSSRAEPHVTYVAPSKGHGWRPLPLPQRGHVATGMGGPLHELATLYAGLLDVLAGDGALAIPPGLLRLATAPALPVGVGDALPPHWPFGLGLMLDLGSYVGARSVPASSFGHTGGYANTTEVVGLADPDARLAVAVFVSRVSRRAAGHIKTLLEAIYSDLAAIRSEARPDKRPQRADPELEGRVAVVTAAGSGIGRATAIALARAGVHVAVTDADEGRTCDVAVELSKAGTEGIAVVCDVRNVEHWHHLRELVADRFGRVDILMNNAGTYPAGLPEHLTLDDWHAAIDVNLLGVVRGVSTFLPLFLGQGSGHIVNTASRAALFADSPYAAAYAATKAAVLSFSEVLVLSTRERGVHVTCVCPGPVSSNFGEHIRFSGPPPEWAEGGEVIIRGAPPEDIADLVVEAIRSRTFFVTNEDEIRSDAARHNADMDAFVDDVLRSRRFW